MDKPRLYHNPKCAKSREALALIRARGIEPDVILYLAQPPSSEELDRVATALGREPQGLVRAKEPRFRELGLDLRDQRSRRDWLRILSENPVLIERPILVVGRRARLGRPPEAVLELLEEERRGDEAR